MKQQIAVKYERDALMFGISFVYSVYKITRVLLNYMDGNSCESISRFFGRVEYYYNNSLPFVFSVFRAGEQGRYWYAVLGGSLVCI